MSQQTRRNIRTAEELSINIRDDVTVDDFLKIQALTFERQKTRNTQCEAVLRKLISAARKRAQGAIFGGYDKEGKLHAAAFIVWQNSCAYYIAGGGDCDLRNSGAHSLVMWEALRQVAQYTDTFDFEGSMIPGVERFFREFGAKQTPYFLITRGRPTIVDRFRIKQKYMKEK
jgi:lipid II:glycine glycyltransferase (peptidoglycan interpeptide bridge formation enzyme)